MVRCFFKPIVFNHETFQHLPSCYYKLHKEENFPIGSVMLRNDDGTTWPAEIIENVEQRKSYVITNGWNQIAEDLKIEENDFIIFELLEDHVFKVSHLHLKQITRKFHFWCLILPIKKLKLSHAYIKHNYGENVESIPITINFGNEYQWEVLLEKKAKGYYFTDGWYQVFLDLNLQLGDFITFEKDSENSFKVEKFLHDGLQFLPNGNEIMVDDHLIEKENVVKNDAAVMKFKDQEVQPLKKKKKLNVTPIDTDVVEVLNIPEDDEVEVNLK